MSTYFFSTWPKWLRFLHVIHKLISNKVQLANTVLGFTAIGHFLPPLIRRCLEVGYCFGFSREIECNRWGSLLGIYRCPLPFESAWDRYRSLTAMVQFQLICMIVIITELSAWPDFCSPCMEHSHFLSVVSCLSILTSIHGRTVIYKPIS